MELFTIDDRIRNIPPWGKVPPVTTRHKRSLCLLLKNFHLDSVNNDPIFFLIQLREDLGRAPGGLRHRVLPHQPPRPCHPAEATRPEPVPSLPNHSEPSVDRVSDLPRDHLPPEGNYYELFAKML